MTLPTMTNYAYQSALGNVAYNIVTGQAVPMINAGLGVLFGAQRLDTTKVVGTFTLSYLGQTTAALTAVSTAGDIEAALEALSTVGAGNATVTANGDGTFTVLLFAGLNGGVTANVSVDSQGAPAGAVWSSLLQFDAPTVIYRNQRAISQPTICVYTSHDGLAQNPLLATSTGLVAFSVMVSMRLPYVIAPPALTGNEPEAFARVGDLFRDTIASVFASEQNLVPAAKNAAGQSILPPLDNVFGMLLYAGCVDDLSVKDAAGSLQYSKWDCTILAVKTTQFNRVGS